MSKTQIITVILFQIWVKLGSEFAVKVTDRLPYMCTSMALNE